MDKLTRWAGACKGIIHLSVCRWLSTGFKDRSSIAVHTFLYCHTINHLRIRHLIWSRRRGLAIGAKKCIAICIGYTQGAYPRCRWRLKSNKVSLKTFRWSLPVLSSSCGGLAVLIPVFSNIFQFEWWIPLARSLCIRQIIDWWVRNSLLQCLIPAGRDWIPPRRHDLWSVRCKNSSQLETRLPICLVMES